MERNGGERVGGHAVNFAGLMFDGDDSDACGEMAEGFAEFGWREWGAHQIWGKSHAATCFRSERRSQKSSKRPLSLLQRRAMMALAPFTVQCMPARLSRVPITSLQPASTTPVEVQKHCLCNSGYRMRRRFFQT